MSTPAAAMGWRHPLFAVTEAGMGCRLPFTVAQWRELEHQALIYKYLVAGVPVPKDLLIPIHRSFDSFYHRYPALGYCSSYCGKKLDPEPGRCRRTDGKKWRCSKDAHPESKYCERHMNRGRNRSRKPVESKTSSHPRRESHSSSSTVTTSAASDSGISFQNTSLQSTVSGVSKSQGLPSSSHCGSSLLQLNTISYKTGSKYDSYSKHHDGAKVEVDEHDFFAESPHSTQDSLRMNSSLNSSSGLISSKAFLTSNSCSESRFLSHSQHNFHTMENLNDVTISSAPKQLEDPHSFFRSEFGSPDQGKHEYQGLRHLLEWSKGRDLWLNLEDEQSKQNSSTTQLSISGPMAPDFSGTTSCSRSDN
ncbi:Growth-regulating factor 3 [Platanthera zijinensis]|uniref:Growth-regulating factor n=1 Tax=Platanthera zijinensis TaxID=2320716 RepID=A0AAP0BAV5_9ASPA